MNKDIPKYDFKQGLPQEFEILNMMELYKDFQEDLTSPHRAEFYQILWFKKGNPTHFVDFNPIKIIPNTVLFINKNSVQQFDNKVDFDGEIILFTDNFFCKDKNDTKFLKSTILFNDLFTISTVLISNLSSFFNDFIKFVETELKNKKDQYQSDILRNNLKNVLLLSERERRKQDL